MIISGSFPRSFRLCPPDSPLSAELRASTRLLGDFLSRGKGTSCAAGSGGRGRGVRGRRRKEAWSGSGRLCSPERGKAEREADLGLRKAADILSMEADHGTFLPAGIVSSRGQPADKSSLCNT